MKTWYESMYALCMKAKMYERLLKRADTSLYDKMKIEKRLNKCKDQLWELCLIK
jgi:hypothetical protein